MLGLFKVLVPSQRLHLERLALDLHAGELLFSGFQRQNIGVRPFGLCLTF